MLSCNCGSVGKKRGGFPDTARPVSTWTTVLSQIVTAQLFHQKDVTIVFTLGSAGTVAMVNGWY